MDLRYTLEDEEQTPLGRLSLVRYDAPGGEQGWEIRIEDRFLMASHGAHSERAMATLAWEHWAAPLATGDPRAAVGLRVLVGGLGAGHTLRAALDLPGVEKVDVVEIGTKVAEWNRRYFASVNGGAVDDPRVQVGLGDLAECLRRSPGRWDLALLDVDNGPGDLTAAGNGWLYSVEGLRCSGAALRAGGVLALWSPQRNEPLERALAEAFGSFAACDTAALGRPLAEPGDCIYLARRPA